MKDKTIAILKKIAEDFKNPDNINPKNYFNYSKCEFCEIYRDENLLYKEKSLCRGCIFANENGFAGCLNSRFVSKIDNIFDYLREGSPLLEHQRDYIKKIAIIIEEEVIPEIKKHPEEQFTANGWTPFKLPEIIDKIMEEK